MVSACTGGRFYEVEGRITAGRPLQRHHHFSFGSVCALPVVENGERSMKLAGLQTDLFQQCGQLCSARRVDGVVPKAGRRERCGGRDGR